MIGYITIGVNDLAKAKAFYSELLADLGAKVTIEMDRIVFFGSSMDQPMLAVCVPYNGDAPNPGNGNMFAITGGSKQNVDELYHKAIELGASCDGEPGQRIPDMFYGAYVRDPDGNKMAFYVFG
ncbi:MAG: VOC family protein [Haliea sp.]|jgi:predicted lactoylglutathione lyase|nr:VOC family protein [Haliea sp.]MDP5065131.1 VOC family protein [Haliea sp.]